MTVVQDKNQNRTSAAISPPALPEHVHLPDPVKPIRRKKRWVRWTILGVLLIVGAGGAIGAMKFLSASSEKSHGPVQAVVRGPLTISFTVDGSVNSRDQVVLKSEVEGQNAILYIITEGVRVEKDTLLVELDSSKLIENRDQQIITVQNAEANYIRAQENQKVTESQTKSDISAAELALGFAEQDLKKYQEGEYPQQVEQAQADITIARAKCKQDEEQLTWSQRLADEGYVTQTELEADRLTANKSKLDLQLAESKLKLLKEYTHDRQTKQLTSDVEQARMALERTLGKAKADLVQAQADLTAKESEYNRQKARLDKLNDQVAKCRIVAPVDGEVIYATTGKGSRWGAADPLQQGTNVRERDELIHMPTSNSMKVDVKVQEASFQKVKMGMPAKVTVDAMGGKTFMGRVGKIPLAADAAGWWNSYRKEYGVEIFLEGDTSGLRAGMSCRTELISAEYSDALYIPVQAVVRVKDEAFVEVAHPDGIETRKIEVGLDNNSQIHVISGLKVGEQVLLNPTLQRTGSDATPSTMPAKGPDEDQGARQQPGAGGPGGENGGAASPGGTADGGEARPRRQRTPEERQKYLESLSPEQRAEAQKRMTERAGGATSRPAGPGAPAPTTQPAQPAARPAGGAP